MRDESVDFNEQGIHTTTKVQHKPTNFAVEQKLPYKNSKLNAVIVSSPSMSIQTSKLFPRTHPSGLLPRMLATGTANSSATSSQWHLLTKLTEPLKDQIVHDSPGYSTRAEIPTSLLQNSQPEALAVSPPRNINAIWSFTTTKNPNRMDSIVLVETTLVESFRLSRLTES